MSKRSALLYLAAGLYVGAGFLHFFKTKLYLTIMPQYVPWPLAAVYISGAAEVAGGFGLLLPHFRRMAAWGIVALLIAVFPANVNMALHPEILNLQPIPPILLWARLPLQLVLIWWVLWCTAKTHVSS